MAKILIVTAGITSHLYSHLALALELRPAGFDFAIGSHNKRTRDDVEAAGLEFIHLRSPQGSWSPAPYAPGIGGWLDGGAYAARRRRVVLAGAGLPQAVDGYGPDLILVDAELHEFVILAMRTGRPAATIDFHLSVIRKPSVPRLSHFHVPRDTLMSRISCSYHWRLESARQRVMRRMRWLSSRGRDKHSVLRELADEAGLDFGSLVDTRHWQHYTFPALPCLRATVPELDFGPASPAPNERFIGPLILDSEHRHYDEETSRQVSDFVSRQPGESPRVLLSLGSILDSPDLVRAAVAAVAGKPVTLLVSSKHAHKSFDDSGLPSNVFIAPWLPLKALLPSARLMITHGGVATIHECIDAGVPMLLYSQNVMDMNGNVARVHGKGLGMAGRPDDSPDTMWDRMQTLLSDQAYRERCIQMRDNFSRYGGRERRAEVIGSLLTGAGAPP